MCDFISDSVLDMASSNDELSKKAVERSIKDNKIWIFGEAKTKARLNYTEIVNTALKINNIKWRIYYKCRCWWAITRN